MGDLRREHFLALGLRKPGFAVIKRNIVNFNISVFAKVLKGPVVDHAGLLVKDHLGIQCGKHGFFRDGLPAVQKSTRAKAAVLHRHCGRLGILCGGFFAVGQHLQPAAGGWLLFCGLRVIAAGRRGIGGFGHRCRRGHGHGAAARAAAAVCRAACALPGTAADHRIGFAAVYNVIHNICAACTRSALCRVHSVGAVRLLHTVKQISAVFALAHLVFARLILLPEGILFAGLIAVFAGRRAAFGKQQLVILHGGRTGAGRKAAPGPIGQRQPDTACARSRSGCTARYNFCENWFHSCFPLGSAVSFLWQRYGRGGVFA